MSHCPFIGQPSPAETTKFMTSPCFSCSVHKMHLLFLSVLLKYCTSKRAMSLHFTAVRQKKWQFCNLYTATGIIYFFLCATWDSTTIKMWLTVAYAKALSAINLTNHCTFSQLFLKWQSWLFLSLPVLHAHISPFNSLLFNPTDSWRCRQKSRFLRLCRSGSGIFMDLFWALWACLV